MITREEFSALRAEVALLRSQQIESRFGSVPASIGLIEKRLGEATSDDDRALLYSLLVSECSRSRNDSLYLDCLRRRVLAFPSDPTAHSGLAITLAMVGSEHRDEALVVADKAIALAKAQDRQVRYCATNLVRIALILDDYEVLNRGLRELVEDADNVREEDSRYEFDFIDKIDVQRVDTGLLERYKNLGA
ncbi:MAG TPA: hypothetical protein VF816_09735 [Rhodocyclaceae bacterium]